MGNRPSIKSTSSSILGKRSFYESESNSKIIENLSATSLGPQTGAAQVEYPSNKKQKTHHSQTTKIMNSLNTVDEKTADEKVDFFMNCAAQFLKEFTDENISLESKSGIFKSFQDSSVKLLQELPEKMTKVSRPELVSQLLFSLSGFFHSHSIISQAREWAGRLMQVLSRDERADVASGIIGLTASLGATKKSQRTLGSLLADIISREIIEEKDGEYQFTRDSLKSNVIEIAAAIFHSGEDQESCEMYRQCGFLLNGKLFAPIFYEFKSRILPILLAEHKSSENSVEGQKSPFQDSIDLQCSIAVLKIMLEKLHPNDIKFFTFASKQGLNLLKALTHPARQYLKDPDSSIIASLPKIPEPEEVPDPVE